MKTNEQFLKEITALMADTWLAACDRRVIASEMDGKSFSVVDQQLTRSLFGPASADECRLFIHRAAAMDVLLAIGAAPWDGSLAQQPSREFASSDPTMRTQDAGFKSPGSAQRFLSTHAAAFNAFNVQRHLTSGKTHRGFRASAMQT
jgi:hypothetical protein